MLDNIIIAIDAMGGDNAPKDIVKGTIEYIKSNEGIKVILVGQEDLINAELNKYSFNSEQISIVNALEIITNEDSPTVAIKKKKNSSMVVGLKLVKDGTAQAFISAGNTGALLTGSTLIIGRVQGVERPALGVLLPNKKGASLLLDVGANVDAKPQYLLQFAKMGSVYMENVMNLKNPKVGLINIGSEEEKGNLLIKEVFPLIKESEINFIGNVEAREISSGNADVLVCDAFVGNVILKYSEGFSKFLLSMIKNELMSSFMSKLGALLCSNAFKNLKSKFDYSHIGGAPLLGLKALVVKAHGNSDYMSIKGAINQCVTFIEHDITEKIKKII